MAESMEKLQLACRTVAQTHGIDRNLVYGEGRWPHPRIMLIGEAPGAQEEQQGHPFVGKAGKNLDHFIQVLALRREDLYITNTVKFRPIRVSSKGTVSNRTPTRTECSWFAEILEEEIRLVSPDIIVTLGNTPLAFFTCIPGTIGDAHGQLLSVTVQDTAFPLFPLYHPAAIIYNRALKTTYEKDLDALRTYLESTMG